MKVIISVGGRFHAFYLAQQLLKRGYLDKLITSYPKFETVKYGIPKGKIESILIKEILQRGWSKLPQFCRNLYNPQFFISDLYDRLAVKKIVKSDIFVGWSSFSLHSLRKAKKLGALTILERGSSHIIYQNEVLRKEYKEFGVKPHLAHLKIIEKELKEYEEADYISIPSLFVKRTFLEYGVPENKLIQVPYGVDLAQFRQIPKNDNVFRIIFAGGMSLRKGVHYLLQAFSELNLPNSELLLIGSINDEIKPFFRKYGVRYRGSTSQTLTSIREEVEPRKIKKNTRTPKNSKITYIGHIPQRELYKYYSQGSVFAIMSIEEGLAMVQPQAMACGLPVICTTNTGGEDIVRDGKDGFVIPIRDVEKLKEKLVYLYENPEICWKMGESAKQRVSQGFTWDDYGDKIIKLYADILNRKN